MAVEQNTYSRADLIADVAASMSMTKTDTEAVIKYALDKIASVTASGRRVELRGFAVFQVKHRAAKKSRNPQTGEPIDVPARDVAICKVKFKID